MFFCGKEKGGRRADDPKKSEPPKGTLAVYSVASPEPNGFTALGGLFYCLNRS